MGRILWAWCFGWLLLLGLATGARADEVRVCVRPSDIPDSVGRWIRLPGGKTLITASEETFRDKSRGYTVYIFDPSAPLDSVQLLPIPHNKLRCKGPDLPQKAPASGAGTGSDEAPDRAGGASGAGPNALLSQPGLPPRDKTLPLADATSWLPIAGATSWLPVAGTAGALSASRGKNDGGKGDAPNKVPEKTWDDKIAEQLAYAGAIANQQMNEDVNRPDGKQYGIPGGKNPNGPNSPETQAAAGVVLVVTAVLTAGGLERKIQQAVDKGSRLLIKDASKLAEDAAEKLVLEFVKRHGPVKGRGYLAATLNQNGAIGPYSVMKKFTDNLAGKWQAHHIVEVKMMRDFKLGNPDHGLSVILTDAEHKAITAALAAKTPYAKNPQQLWQIYQEVYKKSPHWLKAIEPYFVKGK